MFVFETFPAETLFSYVSSVWHFWGVNRRKMAAARQTAVTFQRKGFIRGDDG